jgi:hypothetical protein
MLKSQDGRGRRVVAGTWIEGATTSMLLATLLLAPVACRSDETPRPAPPTTKSPETAPPTERVVGPLTPEESGALATMNDRVGAYMDLHNKIGGELSALPKDATPQQIDAHQRSFEKAMQQARATAKPGDIFTAQAQPVIKRLMAQIFGGPEGEQLKASINDENPVKPKDINLKVNARYPDEIPLGTVPPLVLKSLPELPKDLEYRFVGDWLIILDTPAHIVADYIPHVVP